MIRSFLGATIVCSFGLAIAPTLCADDVRPAYLGLTETELGRFDVVWKVPRRGDRVRAIRASFPPVFREVRDRTVEVTPDAHITRWVIEAEPWEIRGAEITVEGLAATIVDVLVRFQFADGTVSTRVLRPEAPSCSFPDRGGAGSRDRPGQALADTAQRSVLVGLRHVAFGFPHVVLLAGLALTGRPRTVLAALGVFTGGHCAGVVLAAPVGVRLPIPPSEAVVLIAGVLAARCAIVPNTRGALLVAGGAGIVHGVALCSQQAGAVFPLLGVTLGIDTLQLGGGLVGVALLGRLPRVGSRIVAPYIVGTAGVALAFATVVRPATTPAEETTEPNFVWPAAAPTPGGSAPLPTALAPATDAPFRVFLDVEPFETRLEIVARAREVLQLTSLEASELIAIDAQDEVRRRAGHIFTERARVEVDGAPVVPSILRVVFVSQTETGVTERAIRIPEPVDGSFLGVATSYPTQGLPREVRIRWDLFPSGESVPVTTVDPENTRSAELTPDAPEIVWRNELSVPSVPSIDVVARADRAFHVSVLSLLFAGAAIAVLWLCRRGRLLEGVTAGRLLLGAVLVTAPVLQVALPLPLGRTPTARQAEAIVEALLTNVYRAFDYPNDEEVYDRLGVTVAGDALSRVYLEHRRTLELAKRGGARARADAVEVREVREVTAVEGGGFRAVTDWEVGGFVVHFGHRHARQNRYDAAVTVAPDGGSWKIRDIEILAKKRVR